MHRRSFLLLCCLLFLTGGAAVGVEVVWAGMLRRVLGSTSFALAAVLAGFLLGMGCGGYLGERRLQSIERPLRAYGVCEIIAACASLFLTALLSMLSNWHGVVATPLALLGPAAATIPLGATFPFLVAALEGNRAAGDQVRRVYGWNAVGGACAAVGVGLALIPAIGEFRSVLLLSLIQAACGLVAILIWRSPRGLEFGARVAPGARSTSTAQAATDAARGAPWRPRQSTTSVPVPVWAFLLVSGCAVFFWEVLWSRILVLTVGGTVYAFAVVSAAVILGIGVGSLCVSHRRMVQHGAWILPAAVTTLTSVLYFFVPSFPVVYLTAVRFFDDSPLVWGSLGAGALVFVPNFLLGSVFPILVARWRRRAGSFYAINSLGAASGALLAGPLAASWLGLEDTYLVGLALLLLLTSLGGVMALRSTRGDESAVTRRGAMIVVCLPLACVATMLVLRSTLFSSGWDHRYLLSGVYQWAAPDLFDASLSIEKRFADQTQVAVVEGREVIVSVDVDRLANTVYVRSNGKVEGSVPLDPERGSLADLPTQILLGELASQLWNPREPFSALLIGLGSGVSLGALIEGAGPGYRPESVDVIELESGFLTALRHERVAPLFRELLPPWILSGGSAPEGQPRCDFHFGDARRLLLSRFRQKRWHVIVSQPSEPWIPGAAPLFTQEFFQLAKARLEPDGVLIQWLQMYKLEVSTLRLLIRTMRREFAELFLLRPPASGQLLIVASQVRPDLSRLLSTPASRFQSATLIEMPADRLAIFLGGPAIVDAWVGLDPSLPVNRDDLSVTVELTRSLYRRDDAARHNLELLQQKLGGDSVFNYLDPSLRSRDDLRHLLARRNVRLGEWTEALLLLEGDASDAAAAIRSEIEERQRQASPDRTAPSR